MIVVNYLRKVFQLTTVDFLVGPRQMVAGSNRCILRIFLKQFALYVIDDSRAEENAHRALAASQQMQLFLLWHRRTAFATRQDDGLCALRNGKLTTEFGSSSEE